jgi:phosphoribosylanthranilate isomerase
MVKIKICGITSVEDALMCANAGADYLGFVTEFPQPVPWNLTRKESLQIIDKVRARTSTVVVTTGTPNKVLQTARLIRPDFVQLHGEEKLSEIEELARELANDNIRIVKALPIKVGDNKALFELEEPIEAALAIESTGVWGITIDSRTEAMPAGTGVKADWSLAEKIRSRISRNFGLAGGLNPDNVCQAIAEVHPDMVDVISGVEAKYGEKDASKVKAFIRAAKTA